MSTLFMQFRQFYYKSLIFNHFNVKHCISWGFCVNLVNFYTKKYLLQIIALNTILRSKYKSIFIPFRDYS